MTEEIKFETVAVQARPRKLSAKWTVESMGNLSVGNLPVGKHADLSKKELQDKIVETYDRWTWDTGSDEDKKLLEELEEEHEDRAGSIHFGLDVEEELVKAISVQIKGEIDDEILAILSSRK